MPRPPSKHGLERKYKSWRKGKSQKSKSKGSLKHQLRGLERLLKKGVDDDARRTDLEQQISALKEEIAQKQSLEQERRHAKASHGIRFLERQRLTRAERATRKLMNASNEKRYEVELQRIALDQVYVAHFPHDVKYMPLFSNGVRRVDTGKLLKKRAATRSRILESLKQEERVGWIASDQYDRLPETWSLELERRTFATPVEGDTAEAEIHDNRFASLSQHAALLEAAEQAESAAQKEVQRQEQTKEVDTKKGKVSTKDSSSSDDDSSSSDDNDDDVEADPLAANADEKPTVSQQGDSSDSESSSEDEDEDDGVRNSTNPHERTAMSTERAEACSDSSSDSSSDDSSSSDSSSDDDDSIDEQEAPVQENKKREPENDFDDFLMPATNETTNAFENAKQDAPGYDHSKPDKSKGWATQRQRPGQFKKQRVRR